MPTLPASDNLTEREAASRAAQISEVSYTIALAFSDDPQARAYSSHTRVAFTSAHVESTFLNLNVGDGGALHSVSVNGVKVGAEGLEYDGARLSLSGLAAGRNQVEVVAECAYQHTGVGLHRVIDPVDEQVYLYTHFEPFDAHKVFACFDQPDLKATFTTSVTAPAGWQVCGNGRVLARDDDGAGRQVWRFNTTPPISTYLMAVAAGEFHVTESTHKGIRLGLYCRTSMAEHLATQAAEIFQITKQGLDFFEAEFGFSYPFDEYNQLFVPEFNMGAMENPGCVTFNEAYIFRSKATELQLSRRAETITHEMAHVYGFGDVTTMRWWGDLWLNETFATYMANKAMVVSTSYKNAWVDFANSVKSVAARQDQLPSTHPISTPCADTNEVRQNFDGITYHKGASVLKQLVAWVGDAAFVAGVREYFQRYRWQNATLADFLGCIETASGKNLEAWSGEWLRTTGMNTLRPHITVTDGKISSLTILQSSDPQHPSLRSHHIKVGLYRLQGGRVERTDQADVELQGEATTVSTLAGRPAPDLVVVNDEDLTFAKIRFDERSRQTVLDHLGAIVDPLTRALCWAALWDMTRDAELPTRQFVAGVCEHARVETEVTVLERLLSQAVSAIEQFGSPDNRSAARRRLAATARDALQAAPPGSDIQLTWARCHIAAADSDDDLGWLEQLLDNVQSVPGLAVDTDLQWMIVARLAGAGRAGEARIQRQLESDNTDFGKRRAASCRAAIPEQEAKQRAWTEVVDRTDLPLQMIQALLSGFNVGAFFVGGICVPGERQAGLLRPFVSRYVEALPDFWMRRTYEEAEYFTEMLYPRYLVEPATLRAADAALTAITASDLPESTKRSATRIIVEGKDGTERALRARSADLEATVTDAIIDARSRSQPAPSVTS